MRVAVDGWISKSGYILLEQLNLLKTMKHISRIFFGQFVDIEWRLWRKTPLVPKHSDIPKTVESEPRHRPPVNGPIIELDIVLL